MYVQNFVGHTQIQTTSYYRKKDQHRSENLVSRNRRRN